MPPATPMTPRRSTRSTAIFTPLSAIAKQPATYTWLSSGHSSSSSSSRISHTSFERTRRTGRKVEEARFSIGDGVAVKVDGGNEGIGMLTALWEEDVPEDEDEEEEEEEDGDEGDGEGEDGARRKRKMATVHWFFRRSDLPSVMRNVTLEDNEVLLAASPTRPVTTDLPISLLSKTIPIYSRAVFKEQFPDESRQTKWKGYAWAKPDGVYWCARAYDKGARGGRVWRVDVDAWKGRGRAGDWAVPMADEAVEGEEEDPSSSEDGDSDSGAQEGSESDSDSDASAEGEEDEDEEHGKRKRAPAKRKRVGRPPKAAAKKVKTARTTKKPTAQTKPRTKGKIQHPKASTSRLPYTLEIDALPTDPYDRALRLLHVGATPESLPCREEEFVDVLSKVEEGVESGGGGCLCVPGTGKTATVHAVVKELKRRAEDGEIAPFSYVEINGLKIPSPQHAYSVLWEEISGQRGASAKTALTGLEAHFGRKTKGVRGPRSNTYVVLMDELDQLLTSKQDVVYNFFNWPTMRDSQLFVIAIANRMDLPQHLAAKIKSRLGLQTLLFQPYDRAALIEIVQSRLVAHPKSTEEHKILAPDAIALAATKMAGTNGDARRVLDACRRAVEVAIGVNPDPDTDPSSGPRPAGRKGATKKKTDEEKKRSPVTARDMAAVLAAMSSSPTAMFLKSCGMWQKVMLAAMVRCVRREGVPEITWRALRSDIDALTRNLVEETDLLSDRELALCMSSLRATHALTQAPGRGGEERKVALGMEIGEVGRVLMNEGDAWRRALAGT